MGGKGWKANQQAKETISTIEEQISRMEKVRLFARWGAWINPASVAELATPISWWIGTDDLDFWTQAPWAVMLGRDPIQSGVTDRSPLRIRLLTQDHLRLDFLVEETDQLVTRIEQDSLVEILLDREDHFMAGRITSDLSHREKAPDVEDLKILPDRFFAEMTDMAFYLDQEEWLPALMSLARARRILLRFLRIAIARKNGFSINLGEDLRNLSAYMPQDQYESLLRTYATSDPRSLWDALFQACMLFRKAALTIDQGSSFHYPRQLDVEMMQLFRSLWKEKS